MPLEKGCNGSQMASETSPSGSPSPVSSSSVSASSAVHVQGTCAGHDRIEAVESWSNVRVTVRSIFDIGTGPIPLAGTSKDLTIINVAKIDTGMRGDPNHGPGYDSTLERYGEIPEKTR